MSKTEVKAVRKAIFPVAGLGTRFLPATKASPKEMLAVVDKPLIQYAVDEAIEAGIHQLIFITGRNKRAIEDHFDKAYELEYELLLKHKYDLLNTIQKILPSHIKCLFIRQYESLGLGHAVLCAQQVVGDEPAAVVLADELIDHQPGALAQLLAAYHQRGGASILGVMKVPLSQVSSYGMVELDKNSQILSMIEKPSLSHTPSNYAAVGRYILTPRIFEELQQVQPGLQGEIQLTDAIIALLKHEPIFAHTLQGTRYDCGSKLGYLKATVDLGSQHPEVGKEFLEYLYHKLEKGNM
jgi:UTP--glucose-1-phosphate uridylyltransferase